MFDLALHVATIVVDVAVIAGCVFAISGLIALAFGASLGRAAALEDKAMLAYLDEQHPPVEHDEAARRWLDDMRDAA